MVTGPVRWRAAGLLVGGGSAVAAAAMVGLSWYAGILGTERVPGLPDPGWVTVWALPAAKLGAQVCAVATVGLLLAAVVLSPRQAGRLSATGYRRIRAAGWAALLWCLFSLVELAYTLADLLGMPLGQVGGLRSLVNFATTISLGQALGLSAVLAGAVFVICRVTLSPRVAAGAMLLAVLAVVPPVFTGHAAAASNHQVAVSGLLLHVVPVTVWAGGLFALALTGRAPTEQLAVAVRRFSPLAALCLILVAGSGLVSAAVRVPDLAAVWDTRYGQLVLVKVVVLAGIAAAGWWQRRAAIPALVAGDRRRFAVTAGLEVLLFAVAVGAGVALSRTPPPPTDDGGESVAQALLGYPMPAPMSPARLVADWLPEPLAITGALIATVLYLAGVWRLRRRGDAWPVARVATFLAGLAVIVLATSSGLARYAPVLFSVHMVQHLMLMMIAPILLVLSAPVTLALRALPASTDPAWPGPREWLLAVLHSRVTATLTQPVVALVLFVASIYAMYFTGLYELALRSHAAHLLMLGHFVGTGYLFFWVVIGTDPAPRRVGYPVRMLLVVVAMVLHAFFGVAVMQSTALLAPDWFTVLARPWGPTPLDDQHTAGGIAWSFGEIPGVVVLGALFRQWARADEREQRRLDRAADRAEAEGREDEALAAYNRMLAELAARDGRAGNPASASHGPDQPPRP
ncbi:cytochrome c oxidase assembly protein [Plantactinospora mayteni]|uniref:Copper resistance protein D n=1 Tax=Plantactinospora mayteni TaxID=566021 RepID=A0ABQ4F1S6_9ACTN|nr:copper resistance protein D [Plantactinospora mayteni]